MRNKNKLISLILCSILLTCGLSACTDKSGADSPGADSFGSDNSITDSNDALSDAKIILQELLEESVSVPDTTDSTVIKLSEKSLSVSGGGAKSENGTVIITDGGTYIVTGEITDGRIIVNAPGKEVILVLENASMGCSYGSPIYIYKSQQTTIYLSDGTTNTLTDGSEYTFNDSFSSSVDEEPNACLYSKSDLVIAGKGQLVVNANYNNGITSKDTLIIETSTITVTAKHHGINGKDCCVVKDANIKIDSGGDALRSTNDSDSSLGYIVISDSYLDLTAGDDGIQAVTTLAISGGYYNIVAEDDGIHSDGNTAIMDGNINISDCYEGIEGLTVDISGGTINIVARDDGINAAGGTNQGGFGPRQDNYSGSSNCSINISGGIITVDASGDGVDSNGDITVSGGELYICGPLDNGNSALDYDGMGTITGGIVVAAGSSGMAQNFGSDSTQGSIMLTYSAYSDDSITLKDETGNTLVSYSPVKSYNCVVISCPSIETGNTYTVEACGETSSVTMSSLIYGNSGQMGSGRFPGGMKRPEGGNPEGMERPEGDFPGGMRRPEGDFPGEM